MNAAEKAAQAALMEKEHELEKTFIEARTLLKDYKFAKNHNWSWADSFWDQVKFKKKQRKEFAKLPKAVKLLESLAKKGYLKAIECLADLYEPADGYIDDDKKRAYWNKYGIERGSLVCMHNMVKDSECFEDDDMGKYWKEKLGEKMEQVYEYTFENFGQFKADLALKDGADGVPPKISGADKRMLEKWADDMKTCGKYGHKKSAALAKEIEAILKK